MRLKEIASTIPDGVELVAVSKTQPVEAIVEAYDAGQRIFGESRVQEMAAKHAALGHLRDIRWHQIGHLQTNKVRAIAPFVELIHSADSARLLREIDRQAIANERVIDVLLEIHIAREESKSGWVWSELTDWLSTGQWRQMAGVRFRGTMGIASNTDDKDAIRREFEHLAAIHSDLGKNFFDKNFNILSMGMSGDYPIAIECGSTMVRIGSLIFGNR